MKSLRFTNLLQLLALFVLINDAFQLNGTVDANTTNPLDIGAVYNCIVPTNLTFCNISYPVPEAVASFARVTETLIENIHKDFESQNEECLSQVRELLCAQYFPRCYQKEEVVNVEVPNSCLPSCDIRTLCDFEFTANSSLGDCKPVSQYASEYDYNFTVCSDSDKRYVTEWMFQYLRQEDRNLEASKGALNGSPEQCQAIYFEFKCEEVGRCWNQGTRIELSKNREDCKQIETCFGTETQPFVDPDLACDGYPDAEPLVTDPTMITPAIPTNSTIDTSPTISATTNSTLDQPNSSLAVHSCLLTLSSSLVLCIVIRRLLL